MTAETQLNPWVNRANILGCFALVVAIAYVIVRIAYMFVDTSSGHSAPTVYGSSGAAGQVASLNREKQIDTSAIAMWSLFGKEGQKAQVKEAPKDVNAPKTRLSLELQGVFVAPVEENSTAMIAESRKDSKLYRIGDKIPGNVTLAAVHQDRVLLNRNGKLEALYFTENAKGGLSKSTSRNSSRSRVDRNSRKSASRRSPSRRSGGAPGMQNGITEDARSAMASQMVSSLKEQVDQNPDAVLGQFGLQANNGRGYRVSENANPMLAAIGAKSGDIIIAVNGNQLGDISQDINLIEQVMSEGTIRATLERNGTQFDSEVAIPGG